MVGAHNRAVSAVMQIATLSLLVAAMAALNDDVQRFVQNVMAGDRAQLVALAAPLDRAVHTVVDSFNALPISHGPMMAFGVLAVVLTGLMFKM